MTNVVFRRTATAAFAGALAWSAVLPASAAPSFTGSASFVSALPSQTSEVRWRRGGGRIAAGVAAGLIIGGIAAAAARPRYYGPDYYAGPAYPAYQPYPVYEAAPVYVAPPEPIYAAPPAAAYYREPSPAYGVRQCWVVTHPEMQFGYWRPC